MEYEKNLRVSKSLEVGFRTPLKRAAIPTNVPAPCHIESVKKKLRDSCCFFTKTYGLWFLFFEVSLYSLCKKTHLMNDSNNYFVHVSSDTSQRIQKCLRQIVHQKTKWGAAQIGGRGHKLRRNVSITSSFARQIFFLFLLLFCWCVLPRASQALDTVKMSRLVLIPVLCQIPNKNI